MKSHAAITVPEVPGIALEYRPTTYFGPLPLETRLLSRVKGYHRREILRGLLLAGDQNYPPELHQSALPESSRSAIGRIHPMFMGGEYLPPLADNETEIARVSLDSTTADQISVRARKLKDRIAYRIVDEYMENGPNYEAHPRTSKQTLSLRELVALIEGASEDGGIVWPTLGCNYRGNCDAESLRGFVRVSSEFYPQLESYYAARIDVWIAERAAKERPAKRHG
jgi:hypothetical protein